MKNTDIATRNLKLKIANRVICGEKTNELSQEYGIDEESITNWAQELKEKGKEKAFPYLFTKDDFLKDSLGLILSVIGLFASMLLIEVNNPYVPKIMVLLFAFLFIFFATRHIRRG